jgi:uncharacterized protein
VNSNPSHHASEALVETPMVGQSNPDQFRRVASPLHTVILLAAQGFLVFRTAMRSGQMRSAVDFDRVQMYGRTMLSEWLMFGFVILGVWLAGSPLATVVGERWQSARQVFRDIGIGVAFSVVSTILLSGLSGHLGNHASDSTIRFLLPHGGFEMTLWVALSLTAGICEETLYRGYLQRQFMALTKSAPIGILLAAVAFGASHSYQGFNQAVVITVDGALLGALAYWRRSVRPGMIAHTWKDALAPVLMTTMKH